jgi:glutamate 5-kinase
MYLKDSKTVVIKIGSSLIINESKSIREKWLSDFALDIQNLQKLKKNVIIVSS